MLTWTEQKPTQPGWYVWFRREYDTFRREFFIVQYAKNSEQRPENLRAYPGNKSLAYIVGGEWYGPIPPPPMPPLD